MIFLTLHVVLFFILNLFRTRNTTNRRRLEDLQRGLVNYLVGNETTNGPGERLYEYLEEPR